MLWAEEKKEGKRKIQKPVTGVGRGAAVGQQGVRVWLSYQTAGAQHVYLLLCSSSNTLALNLSSLCVFLSFQCLPKGAQRSFCLVETGVQQPWPPRHQRATDQCLPVPPLPLPSYHVPFPLQSPAGVPGRPHCTHFDPHCQGHPEPGQLCQVSRSSEEGEEAPGCKRSFCSRHPTLAAPFLDAKGLFGFCCFFPPCLSGTLTFMSGRSFKFPKQPCVL